MIVDPTLGVCLFKSLGCLAGGILLLVLLPLGFEGSVSVRVVLIDLAVGLVCIML